MGSVWFDQACVFCVLYAGGTRQHAGQARIAQGPPFCLSLASYRVFGCRCMMPFPMCLCVRTCCLMNPMQQLQPLPDRCWHSVAGRGCDDMMRCDV